MITNDDVGDNVDNYGCRTELLNLGEKPLGKASRQHVAAGDRAHKEKAVICPSPFLTLLAFAHCGGRPQTQPGIISHLVHIFEVVSVATRGKTFFLFFFYFFFKINES